MILAVWNFQHLSSLAYGSPWTKAKCENAKWLKTWDFSCNDFHENYSQYDVVGVATPQKSSVPISTIVGGDGRAPIVIEDKNPQAPAQNEQTSAVMGKAEPGRDIFAGEIVKDIKSDSVIAPAHDPEEVKEEKEVSSVIAGGLTSTTAAAGVGAEVDSNATGGEKEKAKEEVKAKGNEDTTTATTKAAAAAPAGPLGEAEAEAQKVAAELFPEA